MRTYRFTYRVNLLAYEFKVTADDDAEARRKALFFLEDTWQHWVFRSEAISTLRLKKVSKTR
jgi:hypothetical protein